MSQPPNPQYQQAAMPGCWWHPNRPTGLSCSRCERPACPDCLREAAVGFQCTDCVQAGRQQDRAQQKQYRDAGYGSRTLAGAQPVRTAVVTPVLLALNVLIFLVTVVQSGSLANNNFSELFQYGQLWNPATLAGDEWWRILTSGFLQYGLLHIASNAFSLWFVGRPLETALGRVPFTVLYFVSLLGGSAANLVFSDLDAVPVVGASGAIFGLIGAYTVIVIKLRLNPTWLLVILGLNVFITFQVPGISILGHAGGFVAGLLATFALLYAPDKNRLKWQLGGIAIVVVAMIGLVVWKDSQTISATCELATSRGVPSYACYPE
ncbi:rhomboid family intramembrane serine protease [Amycolatopsis sp. EV170708-02-1]|uniref:rhomboid family intramembrane serine protease n=1 Tax=Amycolatopsis sp. EV170708-02-1 TaxID=2919322 RepID=UPI001F0C9B79|nr:rhomboid family intramembrane serine protease [Amycolatopsis sp. EV170708-02-1]UMP02792.1 rhomboid family intramembrane serine protease [Amycolatopsis sp. EV170708-02-1]